MPRALAVRRIDGPLNTAASNITVVVLFVTSLSKPPMIPATPTGRSASAMISMESFNSRSEPSSVTSTSPFLARLATNL